MEASWREKRWHRPKLPHCPLDTLCGKAPKVRCLCWWKIVGKGEAQGHISGGTEAIPDARASEGSASEPSRARWVSMC